MKNYQINRPDGTIQYATSHDNGKTYFLYGYGFAVTRFCEGTTVKEIDQIPNNMKEGLVSIDGELISKAIWDNNRRWNGWLMPKIAKEDMIKIVATQANGESLELKFEGENLLVIDHEDEEQNEVICPEIINGETYYSLESLGWTWEEYTTETK